MEVVKVSAIPTDITALGAEGMKNIWHNAKLKDVVTVEPIKSRAMQRKVWD